MLLSLNPSCAFILPPSHDAKGIPKKRIHVCLSVVDCCQTAAVLFGFHLLGSYSISAVYNPNTPFSGSSASLTQTVQKQSTLTSLTSSANPSLTGQAVTFTAQIFGQYGGTPTER